MNDPAAPDVPPAPVAWRQVTRIGFRLSFCYFLLYLFLNGNVTLLSFIPLVGRWLSWPATTAAAWAGRTVFHLTGLAANWHGGGSGDTALDYIRIFCLASTAAVAALIWSVLDWRRPRYPVLFAWLRFLLRLFVGVGMLVYGFAKVFPLQMREPSYAILNNTYGNSAPMTLLWTLLGLHPGYEMICGLAEVAGGVLLLVRRTATAGALFSAFVIANVVLYNFFFDVPVKIYSLHLLVLCLYLILPELGALWRFFVLKQPATLTAPWIPPASRKSFLVTTRVIEWLYLGLFSLALVVSNAFAWHSLHGAAAAMPLAGAWQIEAVETPNPEAAGLVSAEGQHWATLYIDNRVQGFLRAADGQLWRCNFQYDEAKHSLRIGGPGSRAVVYTWKLPAADRLELRRTNGGGGAIVIRLRRLPAPERYFLTERGFHWVNEWGYER
jgi:hypothetical protein